MLHHFTKTLSSLALIQLLSACADGSAQLTGDSSTDSNRITVNITDAPVDYADAVVIEFTGITLKSENSGEQIFTFDTAKSIDLLTLQGTSSQALIENVEIPAGKYTQIRLAVNAEFDSHMDSYITVNSTQYELRVPSGSQSGLKLNTPFTVIASADDVNIIDINDAVGAPTVYTIDFDLRKSIVKPNGQDGYFLKPVLRLVQNIQTGSISGTVDPNLLIGANCSDNDPLTGNAVYVFTNANTVPDDVDEIGIEPITTSLIVFNSDTGIYSYEIGFLPESSYTLAFTCAADLDDDEDNADVIFDVIDNVTVMANEATIHPVD